MRINGHKIEPRTNLYGAYLREADLRGAYLREADLRGADLRGADLREADLREADLRGAYLRWANLRWANLRGANLRGANLHGAYLHGADLREANLHETTGVGLLTVVPPEGDVVGWKKCRYGVIVKLLIPASAKRSNATTRKCRAEFVKVLEVIGAEKALSNWDEKTTYSPGETVHCDHWDEDRWNECSGGIHFFIDRQEAEEY